MGLENSLGFRVTVPSNFMRNSTLSVPVRGGQDLSVYGALAIFVTPILAECLVSDVHRWIGALDIR